MSRKKTNKYIVDINDFKIIKEIRIGGYGVVNLVSNTKTNELLVSKNNFHSKEQSIERLNQLTSREISIMIRTKHPTIVPFRGFSRKDFSGCDNTIIFMDYMERGSLISTITKPPKELLSLNFDNTRKQIILVGVALGMMMLHSQHAIHRDLKSDNVLLDSQFRPKITDFGLSKFYNPDNSKFQSYASLGTAAYMAPEVIQSNRYNTKADVYSFGIMLYEIITGTRAYNTFLYVKRKSVFNLNCKVIHGYRPTIPAGTDEKMVKLMKMCWNKNPSKRPTFSELFQKLSFSHNYDFFLNEANSAQTLDDEECIDDFFKFEQPKEKIIECDDHEYDDDDEYDFEYDDNNIKEFKKEKNLKFEPEDTNFCLEGVDVSKVFEYLDWVKSEIIAQKNEQAHSSSINEDDLSLSNSNNTNENEQDLNNNNNDNNVNEQVLINNNNENKQDFSNNNNSNNENEQVLINNNNNENEQDFSNNNNNNNENEQDFSNNNNTNNVNEQDFNNNNNSNNENEQALNNNSNNENMQALSNNNNNNENEQALNNNSNNENVQVLSNNNNNVNEQDLSNNNNNNNENVQALNNNNNNNVNEQALNNNNSNNENVQALSNNNNNNVNEQGFSNNNNTNNANEQGLNNGSNKNLNNNKNNDNNENVQYPSNNDNDNNNNDRNEQDLSNNNINENEPNINNNNNSNNANDNENKLDLINNNNINNENEQYYNNNINENEQDFNNNNNNVNEQDFNNNNNNVNEQDFNNNNNENEQDFNNNNNNQADNSNEEEEELNYYDNENEETQIIKSDKRVRYNLYKRHLVAEVIESPETKGEIFIPQCITFQSNQYNIVSICDRAFAGTNIESLSFPSQSYVKRIGNSVFENSSIQKLSLPSSLIHLDDFWCKGASNLKEIEVDENNKRFFIENHFLIRKNRDKSSTRQILFSPLDIKENYSIPKKTSRIGNYAFSNRNELYSIESSQSSSETIDSFSFSNCNQLTIATFDNISSLNFGDFCFSDCQALSIVELRQIDRIKLGSNLFRNCNSIERIAIAKSSSIEIGNECFANMTNLKSIAFIGQSLILGTNFVKNCRSLTFINIETQSEITILTDTFIDCNLKNIQIITTANLNLNDSCFSHSTNLEIVHFSGGSISVGNEIFNNCSLIHSVSFESGANIKFDMNLFKDCTSLRSLAMMSNSELKLTNKSINNQLKTVKLTGKTVNISGGCFNKCPSLNEFLILDSGNVKIGSNQLSNCKKLAKVVINSSNGQFQGEVEIGHNCFNENKNLLEVVFNYGDVKIENHCFIDCKSLVSVKFNQVNTVKFEKDQFVNCQSLVNIMLISISMVEFSPLSFSNLPKLETFSLTGKDILIRRNCFQNCPNLSGFQITKSGRLKIEEKQFSKCPRLTEIGIITINSENSKNEFAPNCFSSGTNISKICLAGGEMVIDSFCFKGCSMLKELEVTHMSSVKIERGQFDGCNSLKLIKIVADSSVDLVAESFRGLSSLEEVLIDCKEVRIGQKSFENCASIQKVEILNALKISIGQNSFCGCKRLWNVELSAELDLTVGESCFVDSGVKTVALSSQKVSVKNFCFRGLSQLKSFVIPLSNETEIESRAFEKCLVFEKVEVKSLTSLKIGELCFYASKNLSRVKFDAKEISVGDYGFHCCRSLRSLILPGTIKVFFQNNVFDSCRNLESVEADAQTEISVGDYCFFKASKLRALNCLSKKVKIGKFCFKNCPMLSSIRLIMADEISYYANSFDTNHTNINFETKPDANINKNE